LKEINIFLDDIRKCPDGFIAARTVEEAIELFKYNVNIISLDHDLGEENGHLRKTGYDFVKYFCLYGLKAKKIYIHTSNPRGREDMYQTLLAAQRRGFIDGSIKIYNYPIDSINNGKH